MTPAEAEAQLIEDIARFTGDPLSWVLYAFPWGEGELEGKAGPDQWQADVLNDVADGLLTPEQAIQEATASGHGIGKALAHGEPVLTPMGWRSIESLRVGDEVLAGDGSATRVIGVFPQGTRPLYRVTTDDGCSVVVDGDHQWLTSTRSERKHNKPASVRTTREIAASLRFPNGPRMGLNHCLPQAGAAQHPTALLPVEPYLFGCWLGDGDARGRITGMADTFEQLALAGAALGVVSTKAGTDCVARSALGIRPALRALGVFGCRAHEKFIPEVYLRASIKQRIALLQGLLDTDGTAQKNGAVVFEVTAPGLADGVAELVRSLGGVVRRSEKQGAYGGKVCRRVYRLFLSLPEGIAPFRLPAKANRYGPNWGDRNCDRTRRRFIASVEQVGEGEATCIAVEHPSRLFITRDHIVTHNSALVAWLLLWAMSTHEDTRGVVTANTENQLRTKTWAELAKWYRLCICRHWFRLTATALFSVQAGHEKTWRIDAVPWSENNTEAFAGLHNAGRRIIVVFDEASAIPDVIWETTEGALTDADTEILWFAFGNPTRNTGRFRECFGRFRHRWNTRQVDSRTVAITNKDQIAQWVSDFGEDSDFVRVRVRGVFPRSGTLQFIDAERVEQAVARAPGHIPTDALVIGVDVARFGDDQSVIAFRRGRDARSIPWIVLRGQDTMAVAGRVAEVAAEVKPDAIFVDEGGLGAGVVDRLNQLGVSCIGVNFGSSPGGAVIAEGVRAKNKRAEMWALMREWLRNGAIPDDPELTADLTGVEYGYDADNAIQLERKEHMKKRGLASPDKADALALTFAHPVQKAEARTRRLEISPFGAV